MSKMGQMDNYFSQNFSGAVNCSFACLDTNSKRLDLEYTWILLYVTYINHNCLPHMTRILELDFDKFIHADRQLIDQIVKCYS
jgi:hypothetical protein